MSGQKTDARTRGYVRWACFFLLLSLVMAFFFGLLPSLWLRSLLQA